jgi:hypothetical protein
MAFSIFVAAKEDEGSERRGGEEWKVRWEVRA